LETNNPGIPELIKELLNRSTAVDFWETFPDDRKEDIMQAIVEIENGEIVYYEDFITNRK
jgi:hypothetical protein